MRTMLSIDDDVLNAPWQLATVQHKGVGEVLSALAWQTLRREPALSQRNGVPLLAGQPNAKPVTLQALVLL